MSCIFDKTDRIILLGVFPLAVAFLFCELTNTINRRCAENAKALVDISGRLMDLKLAENQLEVVNLERKLATNKARDDKMLAKIAASAAVARQELEAEAARAAVIRTEEIRAAVGPAADKPTTADAKAFRFEGFSGFPSSGVPSAETPTTTDAKANRFSGFSGFSGFPSSGVPSAETPTTATTAAVDAARPYWFPSTETQTTTDAEAARAAVIRAAGFR